MGKWGGRWGSTRWGGGDNFGTPNSQGAEPNAKPDTKGLYKSNDGTFSDLVTDRSGEGNDLTDNTTSMNTTTASEVAALGWTTEGGVELVIDVPASITTNGEETLYAAGVSSTFDEQLLLTDNGSGIEVEVWIGGTRQTSLDISSLAGAKAAIAWMTRANPDTTGASDAYESYLYVAATDGSSYTQKRFTHALIDDTGWDEITIGNTLGDGISDTYSESIYQVRFSSHFHPSVEFWEDWIERTSPPSLTLSTRLEHQVPTKGSTVGDDAHFAGPVYSIVGAGVRQHDLRLVSPLVNEVYHQPQTLDENYVDAWARPLPDASAYTLLGSYLVWRPFPNNVNRVKARVFVQTWMTSGSIPTFDVAAVVFNRLPTIGGFTAGDDQQYTEYYDTQQIQTDHGTLSTLTGEWIEFDAVAVPRSGSGGAFFALAFSIDGGNGDANFRFRVHAWTVEPVLWKTRGQGPIDDLVLQP